MLTAFQDTLLLDIFARPKTIRIGAACHDFDIHCGTSTCVLAAATLAILQDFPGL
jgi:hypothetical protein